MTLRRFCSWFYQFPFMQKYPQIQFNLTGKKLLSSAYFSIHIPDCHRNQTLWQFPFISSQCLQFIRTNLNQAYSQLPIYILHFLNVFMHFYVRERHKIRKINTCLIVGSLMMTEKEKIHIECAASIMRYCLLSSKYENHVHNYESLIKLNY